MLEAVLRGMEITCIIASAKPWYRRVADSAMEPGLPGINVFWAETPDQLNELVEGMDNVRYIFFLHWHWLVPESLWQAYECVCFHMTDLPYGRGGSPLQNLISNGHSETRLSALRMTGEVDAGPVYTKQPLSLSGRAEDIFVRAAQASFQIIQWMIENQPHPEPQSGVPVYFKRRTPGQSVLPTSGNLTAVYDHIRMLDAPTYPPGFIEYGDFVMEFSHAEQRGDEVIATVSIRKKPVGMKEGL